MDWFLRWPREALIQVAQYFLESFKVECEPETKTNIVQVNMIKKIDIKPLLSLFILCLTI